MVAGKVTIKVTEASNVSSDIPGAFYVAHIGAERYRSQSARGGYGSIQFNDQFTFPLPSGLHEVVFQLWVDDRRDTLIGEGSLTITEAMQGQRVQQVSLKNRNGNSVGVLKVNPDFDGDSEAYHQGNRNFQVDNSSLKRYQGDDGVDQDSYNERGLFGNKKQQYGKPPQKEGYQGPGQEPGQNKPQLDNIMFGVGGAVAAVGAGLVGYGIYEHVKENRRKNQEGDEYGSSDSYNQGSQGKQGYGSGQQGYGQGQQGQGYGQHGQQGHNKQGYDEQKWGQDFGKSQNY